MHTPGAGIGAQHIKPSFAISAAHLKVQVQVPAALFLIQLPINVFGKVAEYGPTAGAL